MYQGFDMSGNLTISSDAPMPFPPGEFEWRWAAVDARLMEANLEAAIVWSRGAGGFDRFQDVFYLTHYYSCNSGCAYDWMQSGTRAAGNCAALVRRGRAPVLIADDPTFDPEGVATPDTIGETDVIAGVVKAIRRDGLTGRVGFVGTDCISARHMAALRELLPEIVFEAQDELVAHVRVVKSANELDMCRRGGETVTLAMNAMFERLFDGATEAQAAGEAARIVAERQGRLNFCHLAHGPWMGKRMTDVPMVGYSNRRPPTGSLVRGWLYGAVHRGYWLDPGRTVVMGTPTAEQRHLLESGARIVEELRAMIRPGVSAAEVTLRGSQLREDFQGRSEADDEWFAVYGHGNGLYWDPPILTRNYRGPHQTFAEGMVASTEVFLELPGIGACGFEQNFIVTRDGTELLTRSPLLWW